MDRRSYLIVVALTPLLALTLPAADPAPIPAQFARETGLVIPPDMQARHRLSWAKHGAKLSAAALKYAAVTSYDGTNLCPPIENQGSCGSCYVFSGTFACNTAFNKAHNTNTFIFSPQYALDYDTYVNGCNGGWPEDVAKWAKSTGLAKTADYGPYVQGPSRKKPVGTLYKIDDYGYVSSESGVPEYALFKAAMIEHGPMAVCVYADNAFMNASGSGVFMGSSNRMPNHAVAAVAFDDTKANGKPAIKVRNSWGTSWGDGGYLWCAYGANNVGYGAMWASIAAVDPPTPPVPPTPPAPPVPVVTTISGPATFAEHTVGVFTVPNTGQLLVHPPSGLHVVQRSGEWFVTGIPGSYTFSGYWIDFDNKKANEITCAFTITSVVVPKVMPPAPLPKIIPPSKSSMHRRLNPFDSNGLELLCLAF